MQKKHLIGAGITAFSVILGLLWLIPLIWLIGTAFSVPSFHPPHLHIPIRLPCTSVWRSPGRLS